MLKESLAEKLEDDDHQENETGQPINQPSVHIGHMGMEFSPVIIVGSDLRGIVCRSTAPVLSATDPPIRRESRTIAPGT
jgi:hypothetical protein